MVGVSADSAEVNDNRCEDAVEDLKQLVHPVAAAVDELAKLFFARCDAKKHLRET